MKTNTPEYNHQYYLKHQKHITKINRIYSRKHKEERKIWTKNWQLTHPEKIKENWIRAAAKPNKIKTMI